MQQTLQILLCYTHRRATRSELTPDMTSILWANISFLMWEVSFRVMKENSGPWWVRKGCKWHCICMTSSKNQRNSMRWKKALQTSRRGQDLSQPCRALKLFWFFDAQHDKGHPRKSNTEAVIMENVEKGTSSFNKKIWILAFIFWHYYLLKKKFPVVWFTRDKGPFSQRVHSHLQTAGLSVWSECEWQWFFFLNYCIYFWR